MVDRHVVKMIVETAQLLSTAHRILDGKEISWLVEKDGRFRRKTLWMIPDERDVMLYNVTHRNHPCAIWVRESVENYNWLVDHLFALGDEYTYRYGKKHATIEKLGYILQSPPGNLRKWDWTEPYSCMDVEYQIGDVTDNYKNYYNIAKRHIHRWKNREAPAWITND